MIEDDLVKEVEKFMHDAWFPLASAIVNGASNERLMSMLGTSRSSASELQACIREVKDDKRMDN